MRYLTVGAVSVFAFALAAFQTGIDQPRWMANMARHQKVVMHGVPAPYNAMLDPLPDTRAKLQRGADVFARNCASCHGWSGQGTGSEGMFLVPAPADLEWLAHTPMNKSDPYIYWSIAEGGRSFSSEMPAYKRTLSKRDIWSVTAYIQAGMPGASP
jgi:mono/diheme cytochrome c family protein